MRNKSLSIKTIVAIGIGAAVFMVLGRFASIPIPIANTSLEVVYAFLALMAVIFGPIVGVAVGFIGHTLKDMVFYGSPWFSWIFASAFVGLFIGFAKKKIRIEDGTFGTKKKIIFNIYQIIANVIAWFIIAPGLDVFIYGEAPKKVFLQGAWAGISNIIVVAVLGTTIISAYANTRIQYGSLKKEY